VARECEGDMDKGKKGKCRGYIVYKNYLGLQSSEEAVWRILQHYLRETGLRFNNGTDKF